MQTLIIYNEFCLLKKKSDRLNLNYEKIGVIDNLAECSKCRMWGMLQIKGLAAAIRSHLDDPVSLELNRHEFQTLAKLMAKLAESLQVLLEPERHFNTLMGEVCARKADLKSKA